MALEVKVREVFGWEKMPRKLKKDEQKFEFEEQEQLEGFKVGAMAQMVKFTKMRKVDYIKPTVWLIYKKVE